MQITKSKNKFDFIKYSIVFGIFIVTIELFMIRMPGTRINLPQESLIPFLFFVLPFKKQQLDRKSFIQYIILFLTMSSLMALPQLVQFFARYNLNF
ncbi:hypothetical protein JW964_21845 [candidate division KSB1 bacterium]|nr:hypothetical protein [candidate division KSB1 bacterium]